ncbi:MAG: hypothetical protein ABII90_14815 [Bacteroidota bacterium]
MKRKMIPIDADLHEEYKKLCKRCKLSISQATEKIIKNVVSKQVDPNNLDFEIQRYHNYTVSFLKEFEKTQTDLLSGIVSKLADNYNKNSLIETFLIELILNSQVVARLQDEETGKKLIERNKKNIDLMRKKLIKGKKT